MVRASNLGMRFLGRARNARDRDFRRAMKWIRVMNRLVSKEIANG
jgi:hypothetical protein